MSSQSNQPPRRSADELVATLYTELRGLAAARIASEPPGRTVQATVLVHEAYLRLRGDGEANWNSRAHFFGAAARAMRRILVEQARARKRQKRGGDRQQVPLDELVPDGAGVSDDVLAVDEALDKLQAQDSRKAEIVHLRYFGGLTNEETAKAMDLSVGTIEREWRFLKAWLRAEIGSGD